MAELTPSDAAVSAWIEDNPREFAAWIDAQRSIGGPAPAPPDVADEVLGGILRDILEALCRRDGVPTHSYIEPGKPAANYALAERLGIGHVFGLPDAAAPAPAGEGGLKALIANWQQAMCELEEHPMSSDEAAEYQTLREVIRQVRAVAEPQPQAAPGPGCPDPSTHLVIRDMLGRELSHAETTSGPQAAPGSARRALEEAVEHAIQVTPAGSGTSAVMRAVDAYVFARSRDALDLARAETAGIRAAGANTARELAEVTAERDKAYRERAALVAYLTAAYPSVMLTDSAEPDWPIVFVSTPSGQMSWHIAATDTDLFQHVPSTTEPTWDGHTTEQKYERLADLTRRNAPFVYGSEADR